jgi:hypothetical protein
VRRGACDTSISVNSPAGHVDVASVLGREPRKRSAFGSRPAPNLARRPDLSDSQRPFRGGLHNSVVLVASLLDEVRGLGLTVVREGLSFLERLGAFKRKGLASDVYQVAHRDTVNKAGPSARTQ